MRITCPVCATAYNIADDKLGAKGRAVRCASCGNKWTAMPVAEPAEAIAVEPPPPVTEPTPKAAAFDDPFAFEPPTTRMATEREKAAPREEPTFVAPKVDWGMPEPAAALAEVDTHPHVDIETYAKKPRIRFTRPKAQAFLRLHRIDFERFLVRARPVFGGAVLALSLAVLAAAVLLRTSIVAAFPSLAMIYASIGMPVNLRGLEFRKVEMMREVENLQPVLVVEGELENPTTVERVVPAIRFALRGDDQQEIYAWSIEPKATVLTPGANLRFRTRLASPPEQASDIQVRMIDRRKIQAAAQ